MKQKLVTILLTVATFGWILAGQAAAQEGMSNMSMPPIVNEQPTPLPTPEPGRPERPDRPAGSINIAEGIQMLAKLDQKIAKLENKAEGLKATIAQIESNPAQYDNAEHVLAQLKATLAKVERKLEAAKAKQEKVKAAVMEKMHHLYEQISGKIDVLDEKIAGLKEKAAALEVEKAGLGERLEVLEQLGSALEEGNYELALQILQDAWKDPSIGPKPERPDDPGICRGCEPIRPLPGNPVEPPVTTPGDPSDPINSGISMKQSGLSDGQTPMSEPVAPPVIGPAPADPVIGPAPEKPVIGPAPEKPVIGPAPGDVVIAPNGTSLQTNNYQMSVGASSNRRRR